MRSTMTIDIDAPPELVFAVVSDPTRWPRLLPHYRRVTVLRSLPPDAGEQPESPELLARFEALRPILPLIGLSLPVGWTSRFRADPGSLELHFQHVSGATRGMVVRWRIRPRGRGARVTLEHAFSRSLPLAVALGQDWYPRIVDRLFVRPIAGRTLATFRAICEALAGSRGNAPVAGDAVAAGGEPDSAADVDRAAVDAAPGDGAREAVHAG